MEFFVTSSKNTKALFGIFAMVFVFFVILVVFAYVTMNAFNDTSSIQKKSNSAHIGVITIEGVIMNSKDTIELLQIAEEDKKIQAIILRIDSPGGAVGPTQEIYEEIQRIDKVKPIFASFGSIAASGGYYVGAATRKIWANPGTLTGSIGVIMEFMDLSKLYEFAKVSPQTIKAGRYKDAGNPNRALTQEEQDMMNSLIAGVHSQFMNDIMKKRGAKIKGNILDHAQGQIFSGQSAMEIGLVDAMGSLWTAGREIHKTMKLKDEFGLKFIEQKKKIGMFDLLSSLDEAISKFNLSTLSSAVQTNQQPRLMFK
jgi:protease-4